MKPALPNKMVEHHIFILENGQLKPVRQLLAQEISCEIKINGETKTIVAVTPAHLEELALGFALSEGLIFNFADIKQIEHGVSENKESPATLWVNLELRPQAQVKNLPLNQAIPVWQRQLIAKSSFKINLAELINLVNTLKEHQPIYMQSGGAHAVGLGDAQGRMLWVAEDVSRHNALCKVLGLALKAGTNLGQTAAILSGRVNSEMALMLARAGIPLVVAISAPTSQGLDILIAKGITLLTVSRHGQARVYAHPSRLQGDFILACPA